MSGADFAKLANDLLKAASGIDVKANRAVEKVGRNAAQTARRIAPRDTGKLQASIRVTREGATARVESSEYYSMFQEFGTSKMAPNPFIGPAFQRHSEELVREIEGIADDVARELS